MIIHQNSLLTCRLCPSGRRPGLRIGPWRPARWFCHSQKHSTCFHGRSCIPGRIQNTSLYMCLIGTKIKIKKYKLSAF